MSAVDYVMLRIVREEREARPPKLQPDYSSRVTRRGWWGNTTELERYDVPTIIGSHTDATPGREPSTLGLLLLGVVTWLLVLGGIFWASYVG